MTQIRLLLVDNHPEYLFSTAEILRLSQFDVITASSVADAQARLADSYVHLGIFDLRLSNNDDETDMSGLELAQQSGVPTIVLTAYPTIETAVRAFKLEGNAAIDYVDKEDGVEKLIEAIERAFKKHLSINWELAIDWQSVNNFAQLACLCQPGLPAAHLSARTSELTDLFCILFAEYRQITIGEPLSQQNGRVVLPVFAYDAAGVVSRFLVSCGSRADTKAEKERYGQYLANRAGFQYVGRQISAMTLHFGANAFPFLAGSLDAVESFKTVYHGRSTTAVLITIDHLYEEHLGELYTSGRQNLSDAERMQFFKDWLPSVWDAALVEQKIGAIAQQAEANQLVRWQLNGLHLKIQFDQGRALTLPHPGLFMRNGRFRFDGEMTRGIAHGRVTGDTILVDASGAGWVVDFSHVGRAPLLIDFVLLETAVKYDLLENGTIEDRLQLWQCLIATDDLALVPDGAALPDKDQHALQVIGRIRHHAALLAGCDLGAYQQLLFLLALARIATFNPEKFYPHQLLKTFVSSVLEAALLAEQLLPATVNDQLPSEALQTMWLDEKNKAVWVKGRSVENLTQNDFVILKYLYDHANQLCTYADIVREGLQEPFDKFDEERERQRLYNAIGRLRTKIEANPKSPQYLMTVRGHGFRLKIE